MLSRVAHLESILESQREQIHRQAEKINEVWKLLQGPGTASCVTLPNSVNSSSSFSVTPISHMPTFSSTVLNLIPAANAISMSTPNVVPDYSPAVPPQKQQATKRKEITAVSNKGKDFIKNKRRKSIRATSKFIQTLELPPLTLERSRSSSGSSGSRCGDNSSNHSAVGTTLTRKSTQAAKMTSAQRFQAIVQVISPASRTVCNKLSQCHTYAAVRKLIDIEGSSITTVDQRFAVVCAFSDKMTKQSTSSSNSLWYLNFLGSTGATEVFVKWLHDFSKFIHNILDEKLTIMTQYMNGFNANAGGVVDRFRMSGVTSKYVEVLLFVLGEAPWTSNKVATTRIDKILKELYKGLSKYNKVMTEKLAQPHKLSSANAELIHLFAFQLLSIANALKEPWERYRKILQTADDDDV